MRNFTLCCLLGLLVDSSCSDDKETFSVDENTVVRFDDPVFEEKCLLNFDQNGDGMVTVGEVSYVKILNIDTGNIRSLGGIEYFTNLEQLFCTPYEVVTQGALERLDVSKNSKLRWLELQNNSIVRLDVFRNRKLETLCCWNNKLKELILNSPELCEISCYDNRLSRLDIRKCSPDIRFCVCGGNMRGMKLQLMWYPAPSFMLDPVADMYDKRIDGDRILTFADPEFERQVIASHNASFYDGIDFNGDGKVSRNEAAYVRSQEFMCDGIASLEDMRYLGVHSLI